jgi:hypothetical protein
MFAKMAVKREAGYRSLGYQAASSAKSGGLSATTERDRGFADSPLEGASSANPSLR